MSSSVARLTALKDRLVWEMQRTWEGLDTSALVALALLAFWLGVVFTVNTPLRQQIGALTQEVAALERQAAARTTRGLRVTTGQGLMSFFPPANTREKQLQQLHTLAAKHGLQLTRADYRSEPVKELALQGFAVRFSLQGSYVQQRQFLHALLAELPNLAVLRLGLEKTPGAPEAMSATVEARLYYRPAEERSAS
jgi:hypothetical protein